MSGTNGKSGDAVQNAEVGMPPMFERRIMQSMMGGDELLANVLTARADWLRRLNGMLDPRRDLNRECGYPDHGGVAADDYRDLYDREPMAARVVNLMPKESWQVTPDVFEDEDSKHVTAFEQSWDDLSRMLQPGQSWHQDEDGGIVWHYLRRLDELSGIGHFGIMLLGVDDGKALNQPVDGVVSLSPTGNKAHDVLANLSIPTTKPNDKDLVFNVSTTGLDGETRTSEKRRHAKWDPAEQAIVPSLVGNELVLRRQKDGKREDRPEVVANAVKDVRELWDTPQKDIQGTDAQYVGVQLSPSEYPSAKPSGAKRRLNYVRVFSEDLVQITQYEANVLNPRFGRPVMYRVTFNDPREQHSGIGLPLATVWVHWSRVIHVADDWDQTTSSEIFAPPRMRACLNPILDIRKIRAGAAEGYWQACIAGVSIETNPSWDGQAIDKEALKAMAENYVNGMQRWLALVGMSAKTLAPTVADPTGHIAVQIQAICIVKGCPQRIFMGSERGELASSQDDSQWNDRIRARQNGHVTPKVIVAFIDRGISIGFLAAPDEQDGYKVRWPDLDSQTDLQKAQIAQAKIAALAQFVSGQVESVLSPMDMWTKFFGLEEEQAQAIVDQATKLHDLGQPGSPMTMPMKGEDGHPATEPAPPPPNPFAALSGPPGAGGKPPFGGSPKPPGTPSPKPGQPPSKSGPSAMTGKTPTSNEKRLSMPQIRKENWQEFLDYVKGKVGYSTLDGVDPTSLKAVQSEWSQDRVDSIPMEKLRWPLLCSRDGYVLDGNHRWIKAKQEGVKVKVIKINADLDEALEIARSFPKAKFVENESPEPVFNWAEIDAESRLSSFRVFVENWCNQYGGTTCKDGRGFEPKEKEKKAKEPKVKKEKEKKRETRAKKAAKKTADERAKRGSEMVGKILREGKSRESTEKLAEHLHSMTTAQIKSLKAEHGLNASGATKGKLIDAMTRAVEKKSATPKDVEMRDFGKNLQRIRQREEASGVPWVERVLTRLAPAGKQEIRDGVQQSTGYQERWNKLRGGEVSDATLRRVLDDPDFHHDHGSMSLDQLKSTIAAMPSRTFSEGENRATRQARITDDVVKRAVRDHREANTPPPAPTPAKKREVETFGLLPPPRVRGPRYVRNEDLIIANWCNQHGGDTCKTGGGEPSSQETAAGQGSQASPAARGLVAKVKAKIGEKFTSMKARYGKWGAVAMFGAMAATMPVPGNILGVIAAAEGIRWVGGKLVGNAANLTAMAKDAADAANEILVEAGMETVEVDDDLLAELKAAIADGQANLPTENVLMTEERASLIADVLGDSRIGKKPWKRVPDVDSILALNSLVLNESVDEAVARHDGDEWYRELVEMASAALPDDQEQAIKLADEYYAENPEAPDDDEDEDYEDLDELDEEDGDGEDE